MADGGEVISSSLCHSSTVWWCSWAPLGRYQFRAI